MASKKRNIRSRWTWADACLTTSKRRIAISWPVTARPAAGRSNTAQESNRCIRSACYYTHSIPFEVGGMLSVYLLGSPQLDLDEHPLGALKRKNRAWLYYVAAHTTPLTRDHLLNVFWAGHESTAAKPLFRTVLYEIRKQVNTALAVVGDNISLDPETWVDTHEFEALLNNSRPTAEMLTSAIDLYPDDFLNDFMLPDC